MATEVGANIVEEDLTFGFDSGYGVADNATSTRFYPGEPTVNYVTDSPTGGGWSGGHDVIDSATKTFRFKVQNFTANPGAGWRSFTWDMTSHAGSAVTISATFEYAGPVGQMAFVYIGQANTYTNNGGAGQYLGYSPTSDRTTKTTITKERISWSGTIGSGGSANQPNGHIGITVWINNGVAAGYGNYDSYIVMSNIQIEKKDHATPFVNGTRADTAGLIDLKRTTDIDLSNVSFNSTGQPTFDGTDDSIDLNNSLNSIGGEATFEMVFKATETNDTYRIMLGWGYGNSNYSGIHIGSWTSGYTDESFHVTFDASDLTMIVRKGHTFYKDNQYHHAVVTTGVNSYSIWIDGVEQTFVFAQGSQSTVFNNIVGYNSNIVSHIGKRPYGGGTGYFKGEIPTMKVYGKVLSDDEIKQNYNAYKKRFDL
jgi:hypothetical protein